MYCSIDITSIDIVSFLRWSANELINRLILITDYRLPITDYRIAFGADTQVNTMFPLT